VLDDRYPERKAVLAPGTAFIMTTMMEGVIQEGTGYPNAIIGRPAAGKTGTTSSFRDAWFVGFVPQLTTAVWVGNDDYTPMYESYGGNVPARIWAHFMKSALQGTSVQQFASMPPDVTQVRICASNRRALPGSGGASEYFLNGTAPLAYCVPTQRRTAAIGQPKGKGAAEAQPFGPLQGDELGTMTPAVASPSPEVTAEPSVAAPVSPEAGASPLAADSAAPKSSP